MALSGRLPRPHVNEWGSACARCAAAGASGAGGGTRTPGVNRAAISPACGALRSSGGRCGRTPASACARIVGGDAPDSRRRTTQRREVWARQSAVRASTSPAARGGSPAPPDSLLGHRPALGQPVVPRSAYRGGRLAAWRTARIRHLRTGRHRPIDHFRGFAQYWEILAVAPTAVDVASATGPAPRCSTRSRPASGPLPSSPRTWPDTAQRSPAAAATPVPG